ncbi:unnamed protein product [Rotaria socialis]|uniref:Uncharacterized protein n=1 Tax=Rotaria socialis TaxID=392032 RepID=A0A818YN19_9BILA|nr:unnamed protein product [Rotaria socialis]
MSNTPTITFSQSNKGKRVLVCDGYVYHLKKSFTEATPIGCIYDEEVAKAQLSQTALSIVASAQDASKYLCLSSLNRIRRLESFLLPKSCRFDIPTLYNHTINVERFLLYDKMRRNKRILIFATDDQLRVLFKAKHILMDSTSSSCPLFFEQVYALHGVKFEQSEFSMCVCSSHGSLFYRKVRELGLTNTYKDDANARNFCRRLMALPLLPLHEVEFAFEEPTEQRPDVLAPLFVYFDNYWMKQISLTLWNVSDLKTRTNNNCEVARSSLKNINDDVAFILIRNKLLQAKIVFHDLLSYLFIYFIVAYCLSGSLEDCNSEYARLTRLSQDQVDDQNDDDSIQDAINVINSSMTNIRSSKIDRTRLSSSASSSPRISACAQAPEKIDVEVYA